MLGSEIIGWLLGVTTTGMLLGEGLPDELWINNWLLKGGVAGLSLLILWLIITGKLVPGYVHKAVCRENEQLKSQNLGMLALGGAECNEDLVNHLKKELLEYKDEISALRTQVGELREAQEEHARFRKELNEAKRLGQTLREGE